MQYTVQPGDSPTIIARAFGVPLNALIVANPQKRTTFVNGVRTFEQILPRETLNVPSRAGIVGDATEAARALAAVNPCDQANVAFVCAFQRAIGLTGLYVDGKYGAGLAAELKKLIGYAPAGCSPRPSWWTPAGQSNCGAAPAAASTPTPTASAPSSSAVATTAAAAVAALNADPNYCASVKRSGTAVNTAVHNFKSAWNAANPRNPVPINTGNYEVSVAAALFSALGGASVPPGCNAAPSAPAPTTSVQPPPVASTPVAPTPTPAAPSAPSGGYTSAQITAATAMNSALAAHGYKMSDQPLYRAFQRAMGSTADGFPGTGTMSKLRSVLAAAGVPMANVQVYPWRSTGGYDGVNAPTQAEWGGSSASPRPPSSPSAPSPSVPAPTTAPPGAVVTPPAASSSAPSASSTPVATTPSTPAAPGPSQPIVVAPEPKKALSTGAIVAGAVGLAAVVGVVALAASGKKSHGGGSHGRKARRGGGHKRKSSHGSHHSKKKSSRKHR